MVTTKWIQITLSMILYFVDRASNNTNNNAFHDCATHKEYRFMQMRSPAVWRRMGLSPMQHSNRDRQFGLKTGLSSGFRYGWDKPKIFRAKNLRLTPNQKTESNFPPRMIICHLTTHLSVRYIPCDIIKISSKLSRKIYERCSLRLEVLDLTSFGAKAGNTRTKAVRKMSSHFEYLENRWRGPAVTWQSVRGDLTVHPWTFTLPWA